MLVKMGRGGSQRHKVAASHLVLMLSNNQLFLAAGLVIGK
jgi:hypothetical protein